jgi:hypothetical protein
VNDQYPMRPATALFRFDGEGQGLGKDYSVYLCGPNSNTGLRVHVAEGFYRLTDLTPTGGTIRITGYGSDSGVDNFTNQTESGPYAGLGSSGANIWHTYRADTEGGNSGSPIIWTANGFSTGIHTNGGCGNGGAGANSGTSFAHNALESALRNIVSSTAQFVDAASYPAGTSRNGRIFGPWTQVGDGASAVVSGGVVSIVEGTYLEIGVFGTGNKAMTWQAPVGTVVIGGN